MNRLEKALRRNAPPREEWSKQSRKSRVRLVAEGVPEKDLDVMSVVDAYLVCRGGQGLNMEEKTVVTEDNTG